MTGNSRTMDEQTRHLEEAMRGEVEREARAVEDAARGDATAIVRRARRTARERMHQAVRSMRLERTSRENKALARLATSEREWRQRLVTELLRDGVTLLQQALLERWRDDAGRAQWCLGLVGEAKDRLERGLWIIEHPEGWNGAKDENLVKTLAEASGNHPSFAPRPDIICGLRIRVGEACLDGTSEGLLAQRRWIEAELLALIEQSTDQGAAAP